MKLKVAWYFQNNMVLQRGRVCSIWGYASSLAKIIITFKDHEYCTRTDGRGYWTIPIGPWSADQRPGRLRVTHISSFGTEESIEYTNILIGDVYVFAGQSNMEMGLGAIADTQTVLSDLEYPLIRHLLVPKQSSPFELERLPYTWQEASAATLTEKGWNGFSALAFLTGKRLHQNEGVPLGLIQTAFGGSRIEPWIDPDLLHLTKSLSKLSDELTQVEREYATLREGEYPLVHPWQTMRTWDELKPGTVFNAMLRPFAGLSMAGIVWYQGESNVGDGLEYTEKLYLLYITLRNIFTDPKLPIYLVQIAPYKYQGRLPTFWKAQFRSLHNATTPIHGFECLGANGLIPTIDLGDPDDIHPVRKAPLAERLATCIEQGGRGFGGDLYGSDFIEGCFLSHGNLVLTLTSSAQSPILVPEGSLVHGFEICSQEGQWLPLSLEQRGNALVANVPINSYQGIRYNWSDCPVQVIYSPNGNPWQAIEWMPISSINDERSTYEN